MNEWLGQHKRQLGVVSKAGLQYVAHYALQQNSWCVVIMWQTRIREVTALQTRWKPFPFPMTSVLFPPFYIPSLTKQPVQGMMWSLEARNMLHFKEEQDKSLQCPWSRMQTTVFQGSQFKKKKKNQVDANIEPIYLTSCFLWSHAQLYLPEHSGQRISSYLPSSNTLQPVEDFSWALLW